MTVSTGETAWFASFPFPLTTAPPRLAATRGEGSAVPRSPRAPFHPSLFSPGEVPQGEAYRPRLRPVQPAGAVLSTASAEIAQLLNSLLRCSALAQIAVARVDEGGWGLIEAELSRFYARGGVAMLIVGRLFELPRPAGAEPSAWRAAARQALERGLAFWERVASETRVLHWPRFTGSLYFFDAVGALHALVGSAPLLERALRRNGAEGRCDVTLHLSASDPEWAAGELELEERAATAAALHPVYTFFNGDLPRRGPERLQELTADRLAFARQDLTRVVESLVEAATAPGTESAALEALLLRQIVEEGPAEPHVHVAFRHDPDRPECLELDDAAGPLLEEDVEAGPVLFCLGQPRFDFRATLKGVGAGEERRYRIYGLPPSRLAALLRNARLRPVEPLTLVRQGPRTFRLVRSLARGDAATR